MWLPLTEFNWRVVPTDITHNTLLSQNVPALAVHPALHTDKVSHKARDIALDDGVIAEDDILFRHSALIELVSN